jgi:hypothetical protein
MARGWGIDRVDPHIALFHFLKCLEKVIQI